MDIVVTMPKVEEPDKFLILKTYYLNGRPVVFWAPNKNPTDLKIGDRVYFVHDGYIRWYREYLGSVYDPVCEMSEEVVRGFLLVLSYEGVFLKPEQQLPHESFQGFHYIDRIVW